MKQVDKWFLSRIALYLILIVPLGQAYVCIHEYGHATAAVLLGGYVQKIEIYPSLINPSGVAYTCCVYGEYPSLFRMMGGFIGVTIVSAVILLIGSDWGCFVSATLSFLNLVNLANISSFAPSTDFQNAIQISPVAAVLLGLLIVLLGGTTIAAAIWIFVRQLRLVKITFMVRETVTSG